MKLLGIDLDSTRVRAVQGAVGDFALPVPLDPPAVELPMVLNLEHATPEIGAAALRQCRRHPHFLCQGFLPHLGAMDARHRWRVGKHDLDAAAALNLVWKRLLPVCQQADAVLLGLPSYITHTQADLIRSLAEKARIKVLGSVPSVLTAALAGYAAQSWFESVLVLDVDDHALSLAVVRAVGGQAHVLDVKHLPRLGFRVWRERLLNALADQCVLQSRRDPRGSSQAEQALFDQLDAVLDAERRGRMVQLGIQATQWFQNLVVQPEQVAGFCAGLVRQALYEIESLWNGLTREELPSVLVTTHAVGRLPGLTAALRDWMDNGDHGMVKPLTSLNEDFGENLVRDTNGDGSVTVLGPDAVPRALHALGGAFQRGEVAPGHLELIAPLPAPAPVEKGPPRLQFQGQDYLLSERSFFLGCQDGCQLLFDDARHPHVAPRHCEILFDHRTFVLFNRSRDTTLVNDAPVHGSVVLHAGDWIRLGTDGPLLRFLGNRATA